MKRSILLSISLFFLWVPFLEAAEISSSFSVSTEVVSICTVATEPIAFGPIVLGGTAVRKVGIVARCTRNTPYQLILDTGLHGGVGVRNMANTTGDRIPYRLYKDEARGVEWFEGAVNATSAVGTGVDISHDLYGVVSPTPLSPAGLYSDTVTVTIVY